MALNRPQYQYRPLNGNATTRILILHPGVDGDAISCELEEINLADEPPFEALSYVWGDPTDTRPIFCEGNVLHVTVNLYGALKSLRHSHRNRNLWADAICINQGDMLERSAQVAAMSRIYASASVVLVYLGEETPEVMGAFTAFQDVQNMFAGGPYRLGPQAVEHFSDLSLAARQINDCANWSAIVALLSRPWFTRKWVIQEVTVCRYAVMMCGSRYLPWAIAEDAIRLTFRSRMVLYLSVWSMKAYLGAENLLSVSALRTQPLTFEDLLSHVRGFQCTDPRDHFFAVHSLARDAGMLPRELLPDYSLDSMTLGRRFVNWCIRERRSLDFLSFCTHRTPEHALAFPSWLPDFSSTVEQGFLTGLTMQRMHLRASEVEIRGRFSTDGMNLTLAGRPLGDIEELANTCSTADMLLEESMAISNDVTPLSSMQLRKSALERWLRGCIAVATSCDASLSPDTIAAFARTMTWDLDSYFNRLSARHMERFPAFVKTGKLYRDLFPVGQDVELAEFDSIMLKPAYTRRVCRITGATLASVPMDAQVGDRICVFSGSRFPSVIRPTGDETFCFIGDCYVDGFMHGEADRSSAGLRDFVLI